MTHVQQIYDKLNIYSEQFPSVLDDFKKSYIIYNKNPDYDEYSQIYTKNKGALHSLNTNVFVLTNDVQKNIDDLNSKITELDNKIIDQKSINKDLKTRFANLNGTNNGAYELNDDTKELYKIQYISNITIVVGIIGVIGLLFSVFSKPKVPVSTIGAGSYK